MTLGVLALLLMLLCALALVRGLSRPLAGMSRGRALTRELLRGRLFWPDVLTRPG